MVPGNHFNMPRVSAALPVILLAVSCVALSQAATAATPQTVYGFCIGRSPTQTIYMSNVFSIPVTARGGVLPAFLQYSRSQEGGVMTANCIVAPSQQQSANEKQSMENALQQVQTPATAAHPIKLVETGWQYQAPSTPVTQTTTSTVTSTTTAATSTVAAPASTSSANGASSIGKTISSTGQNAKQSVTQSVQGIESSSTKTVTDTITSTTNAGQTVIQGKIKGWQDRMLHKQKPAPAAAAPVQAPPQPPANTVAATVPAVAPTANLVPASMATASAGPKPTIQDEGDGKHFVLTEPGQADSVEVTQAPGLKNVYIDSDAGTKYIVMPDGSLKKIVHHK